MILVKESSRFHRSSSEVLSTSWMPDYNDNSSTVDARNKSLNGWLACGNRDGIVSITMTSMDVNLSCDETKSDIRANYNLSDHKNPVHIVEWNPVYKKLASCSALGAILVYEKGDDRWKVDLVNERPHQVEEFRWSHAGDKVMIVYSDGLLVVGTVQGQRIWHRNMELRVASRSRPAPNYGSGLQMPPRPFPDNQNINSGNPSNSVADNLIFDSNGHTLDSTTIDKDFGPRLPRQDEMPTLTCGTWSPLDKNLTVATSTGYLLSFPAAWERLPSRRVRQVDNLLRFNDPILQIEWSCPKFNRTEPANPAPTSNRIRHTIWRRHFIDEENDVDIRIRPESGVVALTENGQEFRTGYVPPNNPSGEQLYRTTIRNGVIEHEARHTDPEAPSIQLNNDDVTTNSGQPNPTAGSQAAACTNPLHNTNQNNVKESPPDDDSLDDNDGHLLAVAFFSGIIYIMKSADDLCPVIIETNLWRVRLCWNSQGNLLAVAGFRRNPNLQCECSIRLYSTEGHLIYAIPIESLYKPIMSLSFGHNDRRLFVAANHYIHTLCLEEEIPRLDRLVSLTLFNCIHKKRENLRQLKIPVALNHAINSAFHHTIQGFIPSPWRLRQFVLLPPRERLFCTVVRHDRDDLSSHYTLYVEFLGGLIPLLKAKRVGKIKPDFVIYDPHIKKSNDSDLTFPIASDDDGSGESVADDDLNSSVETGCHSPRARQRKLKKRRRQGRNHNADKIPYDTLMYDSDLPEVHKLVLVQTTVWATRFHLQGLQPFLPFSLGEVSYKKSVLHLLPREMTVRVTELTKDMQHKLEQLTRRRQTRLCHHHYQFESSLEQESVYCGGGGGGGAGDSSSHHPAPTRSSSVGPLNTSDLLYIDDTGSEDATLISPSASSNLAQENKSTVRQLSTPVELDRHRRKISHSDASSQHGESLISSLSRCLSSPSRSRASSSLINRQFSRVLQSEAISVPHSPLPSPTAHCTVCSSSTTTITNGVRSAPTTPLRMSKRYRKSQIQEFHSPSVESPPRRHNNLIPVKRSDSGKLLRTAKTRSEYMEDIIHCKKLKNSCKKGGVRIGDTGGSHVESSCETELFRTFVMTNKKPNWSDDSQMYQLDFGGRVTEESAKNFQIEYDGKLVLQFGKLNNKTFALDFDYPYSPIQAFSVALANVTARFK